MIFEHVHSYYRCCAPPPVIDVNACDDVLDPTARCSGTGDVLKDSRVCGGYFHGIVVTIMLVESPNQRKTDRRV